MRTFFRGKKRPYCGPLVAAGVSPFLESFLGPPALSHRERLCQRIGRFLVPTAGDRAMSDAALFRTLIAARNFPVLAYSRARPPSGPDFPSDRTRFLLSITFRKKGQFTRQMVSPRPPRYFAGVSGNLTGSAATLLRTLISARNAPFWQRFYPDPRWPGFSRNLADS